MRGFFPPHHGATRCLFFFYPVYGPAQHGPFVTFAVASAIALQEHIGEKEASVIKDPVYMILS